MTCPSRFRFRWLPAVRIVQFVCFLFVTAGALPGANTATATKTFDVPAGAAGRTLRLFAQQSGREIVFSAESIGATTTNAVRGELTPRDALDRVVAGTGLAIGVDEKSGLFSVSKEAAPPNAPRAAAAAPAAARPSQDAG